MVLAATVSEVVTAAPAQADSWDNGIVAITGKSGNWLTVAGELYPLDPKTTPECFLKAGSTGIHTLTSTEGSARVFRTGPARCDTVHDPFGKLEVVDSPSPGKISVSGWAIDANIWNRPLAYVMTVGGTLGAAGVTTYDLGKPSKARDDVAKLNPGYGGTQGFETAVTSSRRGPQQVCVYAVNIGPGKDALLDCRQIVIADPLSWVTERAFSLVRRSASVSDQRVWLVVGRDRYLVDAAVTNCLVSGGAAGPFNITDNDLVALPVKVGEVGRCGPNQNPFGQFDSVTSPFVGAVRVRGWGIDNNVWTRPLAFHVTFGPPGATTGLVSLDIQASEVPRPDVAALQQGFGQNQGFDAVLDVPLEGDQEACVYARNVALGLDVLLRCLPARMASSSGAVKQLPVALVTAVSGSSETWVVIEGQRFPLATADTRACLRAKGVPQRYVTTTSLAEIPLNTSDLGRCGAADNPVGGIDRISSPVGGQVEVSAWAADPLLWKHELGWYASVGGHAQDPGVEVVELGKTRSYRARVVTPVLTTGSYSGLMALFATSKRGAQTVCLYARNIGPGADTEVACQMVTIAARPTIAGTWIAMGDSYAAGDGGGQYDAGTNTSVNKCMRSANAYARIWKSRAADALPTLRLVACTGSMTRDLYYNNHESPSEPPQLNRVASTAPLVTISIGGNDVGFAEIFEVCEARFREHRQPCSADGGAFRAKIETRLAYISGQSGVIAYPPGFTSATPANRIYTWREVLASIRLKAPSSQIVINGYPVIVSPTSCPNQACQIGEVTGQKLYMHQRDAVWIRNLTRRANLALNEAIAATNDPDIGFGDTARRFSGHAVNDIDPWVLPINGQIISVSRESLHPNVEGHTQLSWAANLGLVNITP